MSPVEEKQVYVLLLFSPISCCAVVCVTCMLYGVMDGLRW